MTPVQSRRSHRARRFLRERNYYQWTAAYLLLAGALAACAGRGWQ